VSTIFNNQLPDDHQKTPIFNAKIIKTISVETRWLLSSLPSPSVPLAHAATILDAAPQPKDSPDSHWLLRHQHSGTREGEKMIIL
jgi:hypothetical protein